MGIHVFVCVFMCVCVYAYRALVITMLVSLLWIGLMRWITGFMVWLAILLFIGIFAGREYCPLFHTGHWSTSTLFLCAGQWSTSTLFL